MEENKNNNQFITKVSRIFGLIFASVCVSCVVALVVAVTTKIIVWMF